MSDSDVPQAKVGARRERVFPWVLGALAVCLIAIVAARDWTQRWCEREAVRLRRVAMEEQLDELRAGKIDFLVQPGPECVEQVLTDAAGAANIKCLYLGGDVSDLRLTRLRELPNLETVVLIYPGDTTAFLKGLQGNKSIASLQIERCPVTAETLNAIGQLPNLKTLCLFPYEFKTEDADGLKNHPGIERLVLYRVHPAPALTTLLQSLPRLRYLKIAAYDESQAAIDALSKELKAALPKCQVEVDDGGR